MIMCMLIQEKSVNMWYGELYSAVARYMSTWRLIVVKRLGTAVSQLLTAK